MARSANTTWRHNDGEKIVELRSSKQARAPQLGITFPISSPTYTMTLEPINASFSQEVLTFSIKEEIYRTLHTKTLVQITYSPIYTTYMQ